MTPRRIAAWARRSEAVAASQVDRTALLRSQPPDSGAPTPSTCCGSRCGSASGCAFRRAPPTSPSRAGRSPWTRTPSGGRSAGRAASRAARFASRDCRAALATCSRGWSGTTAPRRWRASFLRARAWSSMGAGRAGVRHWRGGDVLGDRAGDRVRALSAEAHAPAPGERTPCGTEPRRDPRRGVSVRARPSAPAAARTRTS